MCLILPDLDISKIVLNPHVESLQRFHGAVQIEDEATQNVVERSHMPRNLISAPHPGFTTEKPFTLLLGACQGEEPVRSSSSVSQHEPPEGKRNMRSLWVSHLFVPGHLHDFI
jgi:hypothetical protein